MKEKSLFINIKNSILSSQKNQISINEQNKIKQLNNNHYQLKNNNHEITLKEINNSNNKFNITNPFILKFNYNLNNSQYLNIQK